MKLKGVTLMYDNELVSIIMPAYNAEKLISESIRSVMDQDYENWELLITNDMSTDSTKDIILEFAKKDSRIKVINHDVNQGVAVARNTSISASKGRYIAFLDSDDLWTRDKLSKQINHLKTTGGYFSCTSYETVNNLGEKSGKIMLVPDKINYGTQLKGSKIGCLTVLIDRGNIELPVFEKIGHEDYLYWQQLLKSYGGANPIDEVLAYYRLDSQSVSSNKFKTVKWQFSIYRNNLKIGMCKSIYYLIHYLYNGINKYTS